MGSFYTVIGTRRPLNKSIVRPNSHCENCNHYLKWYELIPIVSYLIQKGKCRNCGIKLSVVYPLIELLCGLLFMFSFMIFSFSYETIIMIFLSSLLIIIYVSDFKYLIILDGPLIVFGTLIILTKLVFIGYKQALLSLAMGIIMFLIMFLIKIIGDFVFKRESLGGGDIKLAIIMGITLNFNLALISLIIASFIALPYALYLLKFNEQKEMPFGPFLITSCLIVFILSEPLNNLIRLLYL